MSKQIKQAASTQVIVAALEKKAAPIIRRLKRIDSVKTLEQFNEAGLQLKAIKAIRKEADKEMSGMLAGIKQTEKKIREFFKPFCSKVDEIETEYKQMMAEFLEKNEERQKKLDASFESGNVKSISTYNKKLSGLTVTHVKGGASIRKIKKLIIEDERRIPREFMVPNESKIKEAFEAGYNVPGCKMEYVKNISI